MLCDEDIQIAGNTHLQIAELLLHPVQRIRDRDLAKLLAV